MKTHLFFMRRFLFALSAMCFVPALFFCSLLQAQQRYESLEPGDVILSVNGKNISGPNDLINAVNRSPREMNFSVRDSRTGKILRMRVTLGSQGYRLGISSKNEPEPGGGVKITAITPGTAATHCLILDTENNPVQTGEVVMRLPNGDRVITKNPRDVKTIIVNGKRSLQIGDDDILIIARTGERILGRDLRRVGNPGTGQNDNPGNNSNNDIRILLIYGTLDLTDVFEATAKSRKQMNDMLKTAGLIDDQSETTLSGDHQYRTTLNGINVIVRTLDGQSANRDRILEVCSEMNRETGQNGAVFVYALCHGGLFAEDNAHALYPLVENSNQYDISKRVRRDEIWNQISESTHRATILITDSCAGIVAEKDILTPPLEFKRINVMNKGGIMEGIPKIQLLLRYYRGKLDMNSADPDDRQLALGNTDFGAYFTSSFAVEGQSLIEDTGHFSNEDLRKMIQKVQDNEHERMIQRVLGIGSADISAQKGQLIKVFHGDIKIKNNWDSLADELLRK